MNPPIKKLAITFLLVAIVTSSFAWGTSSFLINREADKAAADLLAGGPGSGLRTPTAGDATYGAGPNGQNMTNEVASLFARELVRSNPEGPRVDANGIISLLNPATADLASYLASNAPSPDILIKPLDDARIQVIFEAGQDDIVQYLSAVSQIQEKLSSNPMWQDAAVDTSGETGNWINQSKDALIAAREEFYEVEVPEPFLQFHKSIFATLATTASFSEVAAQDPVAAVALSEDLRAVLDGQVVAAQEAQGGLLANLPAILAKLPAEDRPLVARIFAVEMAHAQFATIDIAAITTAIVNWAEKFAIDYKKIAMSIALGYLKSTILQKLSEEVLGWAAGEGAPGFVTNWLRFALNAADNAANAYIAKATGALCGNAASGGAYGQIIASALGSPSKESSEVPVTVGDASNCPSVTLGGFKNDGNFAWGGYLNSLIHNPINDIIGVRDAAKKAAALAETAAVNEATAGGGFTDSKKCGDGSDPTAEGSCADDSAAQTITLGSSKQDLSSKSLTSIFDLITATNNEDMMTTLATAVANAVLTYALQEGGGVFTSAVGGGDDFRPPSPGETIEVQLGQYSDILNTALNNTGGAKSGFQNAILILENAVRVCGEDSAESAQSLADGFKSFLDPLDTRLQNIQRLLDIVRQFQQNPSSHTLEELQSQVGSFDDIVRLANTAVEDNTLAQEAVGQANEFIQGCST